VKCGAGPQGNIVREPFFNLLLFLLTFPPVCFLLWVLFKFHQQSRLPRSRGGSQGARSERELSIESQRRYRNRPL
jgi:hypothetical protein